MRIAMVVPGGVDRSGEYRVVPAVLALIRRLSAIHDVHVFALLQENQPGNWDLAGAHIHNIGRHRTRLRAVLALRSAHRESPFDIVHAIWSGPSGLVAVIAARLLEIPSVVHIAGGELAAIPAIGYGGALRWRGRVREASVLRAAQVVTAASEPTLRTLSALGIRAQRVPLGVDLSLWPPRNPVPRAVDEPIRLIHVASLNAVKDQTTLLHALERVQQSGLRFEMEIVGEDTLRGQIQQLAHRLGLSAHVRFHGFLTQAQLRPLVEAAHLMIISSQHETGPLAMLEAAVAGVPTVGTAVGHIAEWAPYAAVSVPVGDASALANAIQNVARNEDLRLQVAREALSHAVHEDADHTAASFQSIYSYCVCASALRTT
jgi:glycosyltransferase involved in cell wall biosynthesis